MVPKPKPRKDVYGAPPKRPLSIIAAPPPAVPPPGPAPGDMDSLDALMADLDNGVPMSPAPADHRGSGDSIGNLAELDA